MSRAMSVKVVELGAGAAPRPGLPAMQCSPLLGVGGEGLGTGPPPSLRPWGWGRAPLGAPCQGAGGLPPSLRALPGQSSAQVALWPLGSLWSVRVLQGGGSGHWRNPPACRSPARRPRPQLLSAGQAPGWGGWGQGSPSSAKVPLLSQQEGRLGWHLLLMAWGWRLCWHAAPLPILAGRSLAVASRTWLSSPHDVGLAWVPRSELRFQP